MYKTYHHQTYPNETYQNKKKKEKNSCIRFELKLCVENNFLIIF